MIGATLYAYRQNFGGTKPSRRPFLHTINIKLFDLIRPGYMTWSKYEPDLYIGICQWLMKEGYPLQLIYKGNIDSVREFIANALFSTDCFHAQNLDINKHHFNLFRWQDEFNLFEEVEVPVTYYRNRAAVPIKPFKSVADFENLLYRGRPTHGETITKLAYSPNKSWKRAIWIIDRCITVYSDHFVYTITYGCNDDYKAAVAGKSHSSWSIDIESKKGENYIDFCLRLHENYETIINGTFQNTPQS